MRDCFSGPGCDPSLSIPRVPAPQEFPILRRFRGFPSAVCALICAWSARGPGRIQNVPFRDRPQRNSAEIRAQPGV